MSPLSGSLKCIPCNHNVPGSILAGDLHGRPPCSLIWKKSKLDSLSEKKKTSNVIILA